MRIVKFLATLSGTGLLPGAPGTWASFLALIPAYFLLSGKYFLSFLFLIYCFFVLGVWSATRYDQIMKTKDNGQIVIDEAVGQWIALAPLFFYAKTNLWYYAAGFVLFRFFDIVKPLGIKQVQEIPAGWGVMLDDVLAGIYSAAILWGIFIWISTRNI